MGEIVLLGEVGDIGDAGIPPEAEPYTPAVKTATQARNLERQLMAQPAGSSNGAGVIENLGNNIVSVLDTAARIKVAAKAAKAGTPLSLSTGYPVAYPSNGPSWADGEWIPGLKNLHLVILGACVLGAVVLMRRQ